MKYDEQMKTFMDIFLWFTQFSRIECSSDISAQ